MVQRIQEINMVIRLYTKTLVTGKMPQNFSFTFTLCPMKLFVGVDWLICSVKGGAAQPLTFTSDLTQKKYLHCTIKDRNNFIPNMDSKLGKSSC